MRLGAQTKEESQILRWNDLIIKLITLSWNMIVWNIYNKLDRGNQIKITNEICSVKFICCSILLHLYEINR